MNKLPTPCESAVACSDLLAAHTQKWTEVCEELEAKFPKDAAMLYVRGYIMGLRHAVAIASRSISTVVGAGGQSTENQPRVSQGAANVDMSSAPKGKQ
jgi:hypothetical protein